jgi:hypothetical protein
MVMKPNPFALIPFALTPVVALAPPLPAQAQLFVSAPISAVVPDGETLYLHTGTTVERSLRVGVATSLNGRSIPAGAVVRGRFESAPGGMHYVATSVEVGNQVYQVNAVSDLLRDIKDPRETNTGAILTDAGIGAAGGAAVGGILTGRVSVGSILGGAAAGVIIGNTTAQRVVVVEPNQTLTLRSQ